ncbi:CRISPR-associated endoribonuclease Cas6 [Aneurinibacillus thermoaerophilus]|uniref:CRISPR-associated endoribonuclease Cas6 n=2 Tax=Aneurinibacillus thermoaerophilus TaxID=143495 RepID=UPI002E2167F4|nr:CRISPR-associated endoribonuclease Cas6 [Aneurinibacillus thermoaerophilus]MED0766087.1 CRISPR-associated endoribonuclease Cas6 [Aneurinibacillus thermoaerophilus]
MHMFVTLEPQEKVVLPIHYNHIVQGFIYHSIDEGLAERLHNQGYVSGGRTFRMFAYSRLMGHFKINREAGKIVFTDAIRLVLSSPIVEFCESLATNLLRYHEVRLGNHIVRVKAIEAKQYQIDENTVQVRTLSPVVAYSTLNRPDGRKYTCYFQPGESDFEHIVRQNIIKKAQLLHGDEALFNKSISVTRMGQSRMQIVNYKGTIVKGYTSTLELKGSHLLLQTALDCGLGSKNAQGFGCIVLVNKKNNPCR